MLLRSHGGGNCSGDGGAHEGGPDLHPTGLNSVYAYAIPIKIPWIFTCIFLQNIFAFSIVNIANKDYQI